MSRAVCIGTPHDKQGQRAVDAGVQFSAPLSFLVMIAAWYFTTSDSFLFFSWRIFCIELHTRFIPHLYHASKWWCFLGHLLRGDVEGPIENKSVASLWTIYYLPDKRRPRERTSSQPRRNPHLYLSMQIADRRGMTSSRTPGDV